MFRRAGFLALCLLAAPTLVSAQSSSWGVDAAFTPTWKVPKQLEKLFDGTVDVSGSEFSIGFVRGRELSGDWGVSYVRKPFKDGSNVSNVVQDCGSGAGCFLNGDSVFTRGVTLNGIEVHKFVPFATIKRRVQIGMNFAGGVGKLQGNLEKHSFNEDFVSFDPRTGRPTIRQIETVTTEPAQDLIKVSVVPLAKVQVAVAVIVAPGLKIRASGGLDLPGYETFSLTGVYLFGHQ